MESEADPMLEAALATMTASLAEDVKSTRNLFIVHGCAAKGAHTTVVELYIHRG